MRRAEQRGSATLIVQEILYDSLLSQRSFPLRSSSCCSSIWRARRSFRNEGAKKVTYSELIQRVQDDPKSIELVEFNPKQQIVATLAERERSQDQGQLPDAAVADRFPARLERNNVAFDSKGVGSSAWWGILGTFCRALLILFWLFIMNQVKGGGSKVMSFGKSRAKRMSPTRRR